MIMMSQITRNSPCGAGLAWIDQRYTLGRAAAELMDSGGRSRRQSQITSWAPSALTATEDPRAPSEMLNHRRRCLLKLNSADEATDGARGSGRRTCGWKTGSADHCLLRKPVTFCILAFECLFKFILPRADCVAILPKRRRSASLLPRVDISALVFAVCVAEKTRARRREWEAEARSGMSCSAAAHVVAHCSSIASGHGEIALRPHWTAGLAVLHMG